MADLFSLDDVRDFIINRGGKVKNHDLVTHFKRFLNDPSQKGVNREKFKNIVNTLATVKLDETGEKVLVLKKKYRGESSGANKSNKPKHDIHHDFTTPMPKPPPRKVHRGAAQWEDGSNEDEAAAGGSGPSSRKASTDIGASGSVEGGLSGLSDALKLYEAAADDEPTLKLSGVSDSESSTDPGGHVYISGLPNTESSTDTVDYMRLQGLPPEAESSTDPIEDIHGTSSHHEQYTVDDHIHTSESCASALSELSGKDTPDASETASVTSEASSMKESLTSETSSMRASPDSHRPPTSESSPHSPEDEPHIPNPTPMSAVSVKDRAKHLNKIVSETDLHKPKQADEKRLGREDDSSSVSSVPISMDATEREWLVLSASADYHPMAKILLTNPILAKRKDFMTGFTALHWASKHGKSEVIKLLCGTHYAEVNARSHGGYTALHLAAMHGHEEIIELLVHGYGADPNIRDYSGKKAKQYLPTYASTRAHQLLQARRLSAAPGGGGNFRRVGSYSAKIQKSGFFGIGNRASTAMRDSWATSSEGAISPSPYTSPGSSPGISPRPSPIPSPSIGRKGSLSKDTTSMPPPRVAPPRRKKSKKPKDVELIIDDSFRDRAGSDPTAMSPVSSARSQFI